MPDSLQWLLWAAAAIVATGTIWAKFVRPLWRFAHRAEEMLPLLNRLTVQFKDAPRAFEVLDAIQSQFSNNGGSSLRDTVDRLDNAAIANAAAVGALQIMIVEVLGKATLSAAAADKVATKLAVAQAAVDGVAGDLADSRHQADLKAAEPSLAAGEVADIGAQTPPKRGEP